MRLKAQRRSERESAREHASIKIVCKGSRTRRNLTLTVRLVQWHKSGLHKRSGGWQRRSGDLRRIGGSSKRRGRQSGRTPTRAPAKQCAQFLHSCSFSDSCRASVCPRPLLRPFLRPLPPRPHVRPHAEEVEGRCRPTECSRRLASPKCQYQPTHPE